MEFVKKIFLLIILNRSQYVFNCLWIALFITHELYMQHIMHKNLIQQKKKSAKHNFKCIFNHFHLQSITYPNSLVWFSIWDINLLQRMVCDNNQNWVVTGRHLSAKDYILHALFYRNKLSCIEKTNVIKLHYVLCNISVLKHISRWLQKSKRKTPWLSRIYFLDFHDFHH